MLLTVKVFHDSLESLLALQKEERPTRICRRALQTIDARVFAIRIVLEIDNQCVVGVFLVEAGENC